MPIPAERILKMDSVVNFGHIQGQFDLSDLTQIQTDSYDRFLQLDKRPGQRRNQGLEERRRQIPGARIRRDHRDTATGAQLARDLERRPRDGARRHADEQSFFPREASREWKRVFFPSLDDAIDDGAIEVWRNESRSHALKLMLAAVTA